jgi:hypothetical protein
MKLYDTLEFLLIYYILVVPLSTINFIIYKITGQRIWNWLE